MVLQQTYFVINYCTCHCVPHFSIVKSYKNQLDINVQYIITIGLLHLRLPNTQNGKLKSLPGHHHLHILKVAQ